MIKSIQNSPSFKGVYTVKVPKKEFRYPYDTQRCNIDFAIQLDRAVYRNNTRFQDYLLYHNNNRRKFVSSLMGDGRNIIKSNFDINEEEIENYPEIKLEQEPDEDYHTFYVFTKDEKDTILKETNPKNTKKRFKQIEQEALQREQEGKPADDLWKNFRLFQLVESFIKRLKGANEEKTYTLEYFEDIFDVVEDLEKNNSI